MIRKIGVAALLGLLAAGALATNAGAQCGTGPMIVLNTATFGYETTPVTAPYVSTSGSSLTMVGLIQLFCNPFSSLNATDPGTQYTIVVSGLTSLGTSHPVPSLWTTPYSGGTFTIYQYSPRIAPPTAAAAPPAGSALPYYAIGTAILSGTLSGFNINAQSTGAGSYSANATFTGGTLFGLLGGANGPVVFQGAMCASSGCLPPAGGYSAQFDGKFDTPVTPALNSTWGRIKILYR